MQDEVNLWLKSMQNAGLKIPEHMRPMLQALADAGYLTDAAGLKLKDLSTLEFEPNIEKGLGDVATGLGGVELAIRDLITVLKGDLPAAFQTATGAADRWVTQTKRGVIDLKQTIANEFGGFPDLGVPDLEMPTDPSARRPRPVSAARRRRRSRPPAATSCSKSTAASSTARPCRTSMTRTNASR